MKSQIKKTSQLVTLSISFSVSLMLSGCMQIADDASLQNLPGGLGATFESSAATGQACYTDKYQQPLVPLMNKLDLLFMVDSSGSLAEERDRIGAGVDRFIAQLPEGADVRIGVMVSHGSRSSRSGTLLKSNLANDGWILDSKQLSVATIRSILRAKLAHPPSDYYSDGGEEGLYSLNLALEASHLDVSRSRGFFRTDAALAVVFVADENDICAEYPAGVTRVADPDHLEAPAFERDCIKHVAAATANGKVVAAHDEKLITPKIVVDRLKTLQGTRPLIVSGILYATQNYPRAGENEYGYGYMEAIQQARGIAVDLALQDFEGGMTTLGAFTGNKIALQSEFTLKHTGVAPETIEVFVDNIKTDHAYWSQTNKVTLDNAGKSLSDIEINYCLNPEGSPCGDPAPCTGLGCGIFGT